MCSRSPLPGLLPGPHRTQPVVSPQKSLSSALTVVCPPHKVTLYSIIPSLPAETSPSAHFPAQETLLFLRTTCLSLNFHFPTGLLHVILSPSWLPAAVSVSVLGPPSSHICSNGKSPTLRSRINPLLECIDYCLGSQFLPL